MFLTSDAVRLATRGYADDVTFASHPPVGKILADLVIDGGRVWAFGACTGPRNITADDLVEGTTIVTAATSPRHWSTAPGQSASEPPPPRPSRRLPVTKSADARPARVKLALTCAFAIDTDSSSMEQDGGPGNAGRSGHAASSRRSR